MKIALFCHSLLSDWNHGNAHFLRGLVSEFVASGHQVIGYEEEDAWSSQNLIAELGALPLSELSQFYPDLRVVRYTSRTLELEAIAEWADVVLVHEWTPPNVVEQLGRLRTRDASFRLLFHDTHHRSVSDHSALAALDLSAYDAVLAFGATLTERYERAGWSRSVFTFHEAADTRVFSPLPEPAQKQDLVFIGNYGDGERSQELNQYLFGPARELGLSGNVWGVRYPEHGLAAVRDAGLAYRGFTPNYRAPALFAQHRFTVHVPRRPYVEALPGIPTIRVFEALACGIPLLSAPWSDAEGLFRDGDFISVKSGHEMTSAMRMLLSDPSAAAELAARGRRTVLERHTCAHRARQFFRILSELGLRSANSRKHPASGEHSLWD